MKPTVAFPNLALVLAGALAAAAPRAAAANPDPAALLGDIAAWAAADHPAPAPAPSPNPALRFGFPGRPATDPAVDRVRNALPGLWVAAGHVDRADALADAATEDFRRQDSQLAVARALFDAGRDDEAVRRVGAAPTEPIDRRAEIVFGAALARLKSGDARAAGALLEKAIAWHDTNQVFQPAGLMLGFARTQAELGHTNEAVDLLGRAVAWVRPRLPAEQPDPVSFLLRDIAGEQARLGRLREATDTAALVPGAEQRMTARLHVVRALAAAGDADAAVKAARESTKAEGVDVARLGSIALYTPMEAAGALAKAGRTDEAAAFLEESIAAARAQSADEGQRADFARTADQARGMLVARVLAGDRDGLAAGPVDPKRLELASRLAEKSGSEAARRILAEARANDRAHAAVRAGAPNPATLDVSTPEGIDAARRMASALVGLGRGKEALAIAARLKPADARAIHESAIRMALARTNAVLAGELFATLPAAPALPGNGPDATMQLAFSVARSLAAAGRTNEALGVLVPALRRARGGQPGVRADHFGLAQGLALQAELGQAREALEAVASGDPILAGFAGPQVGRRVARRLGATEAAAMARGLGPENARNLVLLGVVQEMLRPGLGDGDWGF